MLLQFHTQMILTTAPIRRLASPWALLLILTAACNSSSQAPVASPQPGAQTTAEGESGSSADEDGSIQGIPLKVVAQKWTGDLDGMIERRLIRVLTVYSKTTFFVDKGAQLGIVPDALNVRGRPQQAQEQERHRPRRDRPGRRG
jgi:hypothetical protein